MSATEEKTGPSQLVFPLSSTKGNAGENSWKSWAWHLFKVLATFHLVAFAWVFFRAPSLTDAITYLKRMLRFWKPQDSPISFDFGTIVLAVGGVALLFLVVDLPQFRADKHTVLLRWPWPLKVLALALLAACLILTKRNQDAAFIYFQF
jgi:alginate O-acetyltransferase complex protein AlgI